MYLRIAILSDADLVPSENELVVKDEIVGQHFFFRKAGGNRPFGRPDCRQVILRQIVGSMVCNELTCCRIVSSDGYDMIYDMI
jgi:hypothetical protein